ncbi:hypothetical protein EES43_23080 [Streptomyces sp. ADI96-02]|uniref:hypothetical protein n=1 Tax=unclassified Streptomyces TaxID=2593676 RepID=UPI000F556DEA|nr:hypothetical protein [Streptomyces sp. ADI96-02]RPK56984.1 hypothetical protein EES43_23080 [Streptomyces sp. ADI96-02]
MRARLLLSTAVLAVAALAGTATTAVADDGPIGSATATANSINGPAIANATVNAVEDNDDDSVGSSSDRATYNCGDPITENLPRVNAERCSPSNGAPGNGTVNNLRIEGLNGGYNCASASVTPRTDGLVRVHANGCIPA